MIVLRSVAERTLWIRNEEIISMVYKLVNVKYKE